MLLIGVPPQASWVIEKVFVAARNFASAYDNVLQQPNFSIKMYNVLRGDFAKASWRKMI